MDYETILNRVLGRARRLKLTMPETGLVDAADCALSLHSTLSQLLGHYDLDAFTVAGTLFVTSAGVDTYALPADFGRLLVPQDRDASGLTLLTSATASPADLTYRDPALFHRLRSTTTGRPGFFTFSGKRVVLDPTPDSNSDSDYTVTGVYMQEVSLDALEDIDLPLTYGAVLEHTALAQLASDSGSPQAQVLLLEAAGATTALVNHEYRTRLQYKQKNTEVGRARRYNRY